MSSVKYTGETVLDAAKRRLALVMDRFGTVIVSVSGGKDSTALALLSLEAARKAKRKISFFFLDEEAMYQSTIEQVEWLMELDPDHVDRLWLQVPFNLTNSVGGSESYLICWEPGKHSEWMRSKKAYAVKARMWDESTQTIRNKAIGLDFYDVIENTERCFDGAAFLVGLRAAGESPNRWRAVSRNPVDLPGDPPARVHWGTRRNHGNLSLYPIYDWNVHDVWRYLHETGAKYNRVYDLMFRKGCPVGSLRVSSLIHEHSFKSLCDLPEFEPDTYARLLKRVKGVALAQETGRNAKLFACRKLPKGHKSWRAYRDFLLATHPCPKGKAILQRRFAGHLDNEYTARQQCRQLILNDYENNLPVESKPDPRDELITYYEKVL